MFGKTACDVYREVAYSKPENLPPYSDEQIRRVFEEVKVHSKLIEEFFKEVAERDTARRAETGEEEDEDREQNWSELYSEEAAAIVIHHTSIMRNKRLLLAYHLARMDRVRAMRWQQRILPEAMKENLSPAEQQVFKDYDSLLNSYMRQGTNGVGLDLTLDMLPPRDPDVSVRVLEDYGDLMLSIGSVFLQSGSVHLLPREEAEHLIRENVVQDISLERE